MRAFYASNVFHYHHVVAAMAALTDDVTLASRLEITPQLLDRARRWRAPGPALRLLERRAVESADDAARVGIGAGQYLLPLMARVDALDRDAVLRFSVSRQSRAVARRAADVDLFQFTDGLGHRALERGFSGRAVCERRHLHHEALEGDPHAVGGFPSSHRPDPVGDYLDLEYARADRIFVYSEVARHSFLVRGFDPAKVVVTRLGFPAQHYDDEAEQRDPYLVAFVGRCDAFKGIDIAATAIRELGAPYRLQVAGYASTEARAWLARQPAVDYLGILGREKLTSLYRRSAVILMPSIESFGYAPLEGAVHGASLVCSDQTGAREFLPPGTHTVVTGRDPAVWAEAVRGAPRRSTSELAAVRAAVGELSWDRSALATAAALAEVMRE